MFVHDGLLLKCCVTFKISSKVIALTKKIEVNCNLQFDNISTKKPKEAASRNELQKARNPAFRLTGFLIGRFLAQEDSEFTRKHSFRIFVLEY